LNESFNYSYTDATRRDFAQKPSDTFTAPRRSVWLHSA